MKPRLIPLLALLLSIPSFADRLPRFVLPHHYDLTVTPDVEAERFSGEVAIAVNVQQALKAIQINAAEIEFVEATIESAGQSQKATVTTDAKAETATLTVPSALPIGPATIRIRYNGILNRQLRGFYTGQTNGKKYLASQMEAVDARRAFPSFDEPDLKATFRITVVADANHNVISNAPTESDTPGPGAGKHTVRFAITPRLSTYHIALIVGDFACISDSADGLPIRICAPPDKVEMGRFALGATKEVLRFFNDYFEIDYPFQKLDQIALADFAAGAMENPGAITYRERVLLADEKTASIDSLRGSLGTISHEIGHMWFGDLVTMRWWDDIWLNEGFASWIGPKAVRNLRPSWSAATSVANAVGSPMRGDTLLSTRPIQKGAETPDEIEQLFDGIAYGKTAALLTTLESYVGEEKFRDGVNLYMRRNAFSNASASDFAGAVNDATGQEVAEILASYVNQAGVPVVRVRSARCENGNTIAELEQERFLVRGERTQAIRAQLWTIPVCFRGRDCVVLRERTQTVRLSGCATPLFANAEGRGYYLTAYDEDAYRRLSEGRQALSPSERVTLLRDEWLMVRSGQRSIAEYLDLATSFGTDRNAADEVLSAVAYAHRYLAESAQKPVLAAWLREYASPLVKELGWTVSQGDRPEDRQLRNAVLGILGEYGDDQPTLRRARDLTNQWLRNRQAIAPEMVSEVTSLAAISGDAKLYEAFLRGYRTATDPREKVRFLGLLSSFRDASLLRRTLELTLTDEIRSQDIASVLAGVIGKPTGTYLGWKFVKENWPAIENKIPPGHVGRVIGAFSSATCDAEAIAEIRKFIAEHKVPQARQSVAQGLDRIASCVDLRRMQQSNLAQWLATKGERLKAKGKSKTRNTEG
jgi:aminopeptidase N